MPGLNDSSWEMDTPVSLAILVPVSPGFTTYSPGPAAVAASPPTWAALAAACALAESSSFFTESFNAPISGPIESNADCVECVSETMSLLALSAAAAALRVSESRLDSLSWRSSGTLLLRELDLDEGNDAENQGKPTDQNTSHRQVATVTFARNCIHV